VTWLAACSGIVPVSAGAAVPLQAFVTGPAPVPLFAAAAPEVGTHHAYRWIHFSDGAAPGWYVLYGIVVRAGANPLDPREWDGWNPAAFYPLVVTPATTSP